MNAINIIRPYRHEGFWVFDDPATGLNKEPFVSGMDLLIDLAVAPIPNAEDGFVLLFSATPFPGAELKLDWTHAGDGGNWYYSPDFDAEGWLCPALFKYFNEAPKHIYLQIKSALPAAA